MKKISQYLVGDFETTVYEGQENTEVWASAVVPLYTENVEIFHSISDTFEYLKSIQGNIVIFYHNLKFDGSFWLNFLFKKGYAHAFDFVSKKFAKDDEMPAKSFKYLISDLGQWYSITIKEGRRTIEIRDSLKLLPFSVAEIGKGFMTKHKKLDMEYAGKRYAGCQITEEEKKYIRNDVLVVKEALETMFDGGHKEITIGSCCLKEFKRTFAPHVYPEMFPNLYDIKADKKLGCDTIGEYIHKSYKGGWCYLVEGKENKVYKNGVTYDVNSLYPSMMHSISGNRYPTGYPVATWAGNYIPNDAKSEYHYFFIQIKTRFRVKDGFLPFIQIKRDFRYKGNECLKTSDFYNAKTGRYNRYVYDKDGNKQDTRVILTLTQTDYYLFLEHYDVFDFEILSGVYFSTDIGFFDKYIDKYKEIKMTSKGAQRTLAKLYLNNLYGKMASSTDSSFKVANIKDDGSLGFEYVEAHDKKPGYIAIGSAITSYARNFTIRTAQKNFYGKNKPGFIYADTDSIHCNIYKDDIKGVEESDTDFCCWKLESEWDEGIFARQKTYIEKTGLHYDIKCAGMTKQCKRLLENSLYGAYPIDYNKLSQAEQDFVKNKRTLKDFKKGLSIPGKLMAKQINGGVLLVDSTFEMK